MTDYVAAVAKHQPTWGTFLEPDPSLADVKHPHEPLNIPIQGGHHADLKAFAGQNPVFDRTAGGSRTWTWSTRTSAAPTTTSTFSARSSSTTGS